MCQYQLSSLMFPSDAPMPPCAATVCERVGNTFDSTATDRPASASCSDARMPTPPSPESPQDLDRPAGVYDERDGDEHLERQPDRRRADVIHDDVAHPDPRM